MFALRQKGKCPLGIVNTNSNGFAGLQLRKSEKKHVRLTRIQKLIAGRMIQSKLTKPYFYIELKADVTDLMKMRPKLRKALGIKITTNTFYIHAIGVAAKKYPIVVGKIDGNGNIAVAEHINVGFAVNAPQGLVVPVLRNADRKTLAEIAKDEQLLTAKSRSNKLTLEDIEGQTIALSNLGAYNINSFIGIIPPPVSTIISVGKTANTVVPIDGQAAVRKIVSFSLAADYRVIKGTYAAQFLNVIKEYLQNPQRLL